jgi:outer membrane protein
MHVSRFALAAALAALAAAPALAAPPATLADALVEAYYNNATLQEQRAALRQVDEQVPQALSGWRPTVQLSGSYGRINSTENNNTLATYYSPPKLINSVTNLNRDTATAQAQLTQPIYTGGKVTEDLRQAKNTVYSGRAQLLASEEQVFLQVVQAYVTIITDQHILSLDQSDEGVTAEQLRDTEEQFNLGDITYTSVAQAQASLASAKEQVQVADGNLQIARENFRSLVGDYPADNLAPPQPLLLPVSDKETAATAANTNNPNVVAAEYTDAAAKDAVDVAFSALMPQVSLQASGFLENNPTAPRSNINGGELIGQLTVPIYQGGAEYAAIRAARAKEQQDFAAILDAQRTAYAQATQAWVAFTASRDAIVSTNAEIQADAIALDGTEREELVGTQSTLDVLNAQQLLLNAQVQQVQNIASLVNNSYTVASAIGRLTARDLGLPVHEYDDVKYYNDVKYAGIGTGEAADQDVGVAPDGTLLPSDPAPKPAAPAKPPRQKG